MSTKGIEMPSGLELYPHNEKAYRKLLDMLSGTRRACIIHPTGTGKAFIAYRYAFDHPNERILWMSPSTYIEQEQEASIRSRAGGTPHGQYLSDAPRRRRVPPFRYPPSIKGRSPFGAFG